MLKLPLPVLLLLALLRVVSGFTCNDGCVIGGGYVADGYCDCTDCAEESEYTCDTCANGCPTACGGYTFCGTTAQCNDGCVINASYIDDGACDCSQCEDESEWTCGNCPDCAQSCGDRVVCVGGSTTPGPSTTPFTTAAFVCNDGCEIESSFVDDDFCDCLECDDESEWTCDSCPNCPTNCGGYTQCTGIIPGANDTETPVFTCNDGCEVEMLYVNDDYCDCSETCEDENNWTCETCPGCPQLCDEYVECTGVVTTQRPTTSVSKYHICNDGCEMVASYVNDGDCDCIDCGDEDSFTCESCGGCPETCGGYVECAVLSTEAPQTTSSWWLCDDNCTISGAKLNDGFCDCVDCDDEDYFSCESCGGCPQQCGERVDCGSTEAPETTEDTQTTEGTDTNAAAAFARLLLPTVMSLLFALYSL